MKSLAVWHSIDARGVEAEMGSAWPAVTTFGVAANWRGPLIDRAGVIGELASVVSNCGKSGLLYLKLEAYGKDNQEQGNQSRHEFINNLKVQSEEWCSAKLSKAILKKTNRTSSFN